MQLGMIGLGRMGANMVRRLIRGGHQCVVFDRSPEVVQGLVKDQATGSSSLADFVSKLTQPRALWLMVPAAFVDSTLAELTPLLAKDDVVIDGGNSYYIDDIRRAKELAKKGIHYVDVGNQRRRLGIGARVLSHDWGINGRSGPPRSDLPHARAGKRQRRPDAGPHPGQGHCGKWISALR